MKVWDTTTGQEVRSLEGHTATVSSVAYSPDGKRIVSGGDKTVKVWDAATGEDLLTLKGHKAAGSTAWRSARTANASSLGVETTR